MLLSFWTTNVTWLAGSSLLAVVGCWTAAAMTRSNMRTTYMTLICIQIMCNNAFINLVLTGAVGTVYVGVYIGAALTSVWYSAVLSLFISYQHNFYNGV